MRMLSKAHRKVASIATFRKNWGFLYAEKAIGEGCKNNNSIKSWII
jgi:hypothetical protein